MWFAMALATPVIDAPTDAPPRQAHPLPGAPEAPIVNGREEPGYPSAVGLGALEQTLCTGNLVSPRVVLTAAHCTIDLPVELITTIGRVYLDPIPSDDRSLAVLSVSVHPAYVRLSNEPGQQTLGENDVAVLELAEPAPVAPVWFREAPLEDGDVVGRTLVSVGYGDDGAGNSSIRRSAELVIDRMDPMFLVSRASGNPDHTSICSGDSGGPQFRVGPDGRVEQWAVHSWASERCSGETGSTRTDVVADWIREQVARVEGSDDPCTWTAPEDGTCDAACAEVDPDCEATDSGTASAALPNALAAGCATAPGGAWAAWLMLLLMARRRAADRPGW